MLVFRSRSHSRSPRTVEEEEDGGSGGGRNSPVMKHRPTDRRHGRHPRKKGQHSSNYYSIYLLVGGGCFGFWYGIVQQHQQQQECFYHRQRTTVSTTSTTNTTLPPFVNDDDRVRWGNHPNDGWQTIHVYHGPPPRDDLQMPTPTAGNEPPLRVPRHQRSNIHHPLPNNNTNNISNGTKWYSQAHQDEIVINLFRHRTSGYYIDLAANDAMELSNTYALERYFHWTGLLLEPNPIYWYNLSYYRRRSHIIGAVVGNASNPQEEVYFRFPAGDHGGIANDGFNNGKRWQSESQKKFTVPLVDILQRFRAPSVIDYLSLDVEGAETYILQNFPFANLSRSRNDATNRLGYYSTTTTPPPSTGAGRTYHIKVITAERLRGTIRQYMNHHQYRFIQKLTRWGESLWVHQHYVDDAGDDVSRPNHHSHPPHNNSSSSSGILDWSILNQYNFPI